MHHHMKIFLIINIKFKVLIYFSCLTYLMLSFDYLFSLEKFKLMYESKFLCCFDDPHFFYHLS